MPCGPSKRTSNGDMDLESMDSTPHIERTAHISAVQSSSVKRIAVLHDRNLCTDPEHLPLCQRYDKGRSAFIYPNDAHHDLGGCLCSAKLCRGSMDNDSCLGGATRAHVVRWEANKTTKTSRVATLRAGAKQVPAHRHLTLDISCRNLA